MRADPRLRGRDHPSLNRDRQPRPITQPLQIPAGARLTLQPTMTQVDGELLIEHPRLARLDLQQLALDLGDLIAISSHIALHHHT